jgi:hypothetical protein
MGLGGSQFQDGTAQIPDDPAGHILDIDGAFP